MKSGALLVLLCVVCLSTMSAGTAQEQDGKGDPKMNTYLVFFGFTAEGIRDIKASPTRVEAAKETVRTMGGEMKAFYAILGSQFDTMFILQAPDDESVAKMVLAIASGGNVRTQTHRLFTEEQYRKLVAELP